MTNQIQEILKTNKRATTSTSRLYYQLLRSMKMNPKTMTAAELLRGMDKKTFPSFDTVSRMSRKYRNIKA